jgi:hypothetical protein
MIDNAVVIEVVLAIMLLRVNMTALHVFGMAQAGTLTARHLAIRLGPRFHVFDMLLATLETIGFTLGQAARGNALIDTLFLIGLALVDARRVALGEGQNRQGEREQNDGLDGFHDFLLFDRANSLAAIRS